MSAYLLILLYVLSWYAANWVKQRELDAEMNASVGVLIIVADGLFK